MTVQELAAYFDHTVLKANAVKADITQLCAEAQEWGFASVCVNPCWVPLAFDLVRESPVKVCTVVGFPLGASAFEMKAQEAKTAVEQGAREIDMVINVGWALSGHWEAVEEDILSVREAIGDTVLKVILETCYLSEDQIAKAARVAADAGANFVKTSTGFGSGGASVENVALMRRSVPDEVKVKASGGIRTLQDTLALIEAGAERIGASASVSIMKEFLGKGNEGSSSGY